MLNVHRMDIVWHSQVLHKITETSTEADIVSIVLIILFVISAVTLYAGSNNLDKSVSEAKILFFNVASNTNKTSLSQ